MSAKHHCKMMMVTATKLLLECNAVMIVKLQSCNFTLHYNSVMLRYWWQNIAVDVLETIDKLSAKSESQHSFQKK